MGCHLSVHKVLGSIHTYIYIYIYTYIYICICICTYVCMHKFVFVGLQTVWDATSVPILINMDLFCVKTVHLNSELCVKAVPC